MFNEHSNPLAQDKRTVHLLIWLAFACCLLNFCLYLFGIVMLVIYTKPDPTVIVALLGAASGNLSGATFLAVLARTRSDPQSVTVDNTSSNPVPTEPQAHTDAPSGGGADGLSYGIETEEPLDPEDPEGQ